MEGVKTQRIHAVDFLRGLVMIIMALDHVRDFFHHDAMLHDPLDLQHTSPGLYFTRWITHYCAPLFVLLSGISARLSGSKKNTDELSRFLVKRGLWLIVIEFTLVSFGWTFNPFFPVLVMQVIWAIGVSMIALSVLVRLKRELILMIALIILIGHNLLDAPEAARNGQVGLLWDLLHHGHFVFYPFAPGHAFAIVYPILPWIGIMALGYWLGDFFLTSCPAGKRTRFLWITGTSMIAGFICLRLLNRYGDPVHWEQESTALFSLLSFLNVTKYPPSLLFSLLTLGPGLVFLAGAKVNQNQPLVRIAILFGRVPFFYYILHIYVIHLLTVVSFYASGYTHADIMNKAGLFLFRPPESGYALPVVYLWWLLVLVICYFPCRWYNRYKSTHKNWWLSYV